MPEKEEIERPSPEAQGNVEDNIEQDSNSEALASNGGDESITDKIFRSKEEDLIREESPVSYTHLTLPTNREV